MKKLLTMTFALLLMTGLVPTVALAIDDCPATFSSCGDVPGKSCRLATDGLCTTTDTHNHRCLLPDGSILHCGGLTVQIQNCDCRTRLQLICCPDCTDFTCGDCESQPGSQSFFCG